MYQWRKMTDAEKGMEINKRKTQGWPLHSPPSFDSRGGVYLFTGACYQHKPIIGVASERLGEFEEELLQHSEEITRVIHAWSVLKNHYHLVVSVESPSEFKQGIGLLHGRSSRKWNLEDATVGRKVWYRCMERRIKSEAHYYVTLNYVHHNAVKHGLCKTWQEWPYSSAMEFLESMGREKAKEIWLRYPVRDYGVKWDHD